MEAIDEYVSACKELGLDVPQVLAGQYKIVFELDIQSLLMMKQLWHYAKGISKPRQAQKQKIENALHRLGSELMSL